MLVKSEFYKNIGYSCAVLTTTDCACTLAGIQSLQRRKKLHASNLRKLLGLPVQYNIIFGNLKHCLLDSLFNIKRQSEMAKTKLFEGDCRGELTNSFPFSLPILFGYYIVALG